VDRIRIPAQRQEQPFAGHTRIVQPVGDIEFFQVAKDGIGFPDSTASVQEKSRFVALGHGGGVVAQ
jgi:hypothetical protein